MRILYASLLMLSLGGCVSHAVHAPRDAVLLRLAPEALGREVVEQQLLTFEVGGERRSMDALLEADAQRVALAVSSAGQIALRLEWDGKQLRQQRAAWLPPAVRAERVLSDLQLALWPVAMIRDALPSQWTLDDAQGERRLRRNGETMQTVRYPAPGLVVIESHREGMRLSIESVEVGR